MGNHIVIRVIWITVKDFAVYFTEFGTLNGERVYQYTPFVSQNDREQLVTLCIPEDFLQSFKPV